MHAVQKGGKRTGEIAVEAPHEHRFHFSQLRGQFVHGHQALAERIGNHALGQQRDPDPGRHAGNDRFD
ncbi:hypothetical protein D3C84_970180 [compost metagenome]